MFRANKSDTELHARMLLSIDAANALGNFAMGQVKADMGEYELAEDFLRRSLEAGRGVSALNNLAWALAQLEKYEEAEALAREALETCPEMAELWDTLGFILLRTERLEEAEEALRKSLSLSPSTPHVLFHLAECQLAKGEKDAARNAIGLLRGRRGDLKQDEQKRLLQVELKLSE